MLSNIGDGKGLLYFIYLYGYYFYIVKMGFGFYDSSVSRIFIGDKWYLMFWRINIKYV